MAFMKPETYHGHFQRINNTKEGDILQPGLWSEYPGNEDAAKAYGVDPEDVETVFGWFARYSAPGYLDTTDWSGPYDSEEEAIEAVDYLYGEETEVFVVSWESECSGGFDWYYTRGAAEVEYAKECQESCWRKVHFFTHFTYRDTKSENEDITAEIDAKLCEYEENPEKCFVNTNYVED